MAISNISTQSLLKPLIDTTSTSTNTTEKTTEGTAFIDLLNSMDNKQNSAQTAVYNLLTKGEGEAHEVLIQQQQAESSMKTAAVIRDNLLEGYKQLMNMQI